MEPKFLISSPKISPSFSASPLFLNLSYKSNLLMKPNLSLKNHLSLTKKLFEESPFLGKSLNLQETSNYMGNLRKTHVPFFPVRAIVKRRKEVPFDKVIQKDKKLKFVLKIRKILVNQPGRIMPLSDLGRFRRQLGIQEKSRFIAILRKFPAVFEIEETGAYSLRFKLTPEADRLYLEEIKIRKEMEDLLVIKLRKLLMMSLEKRILLKKIVHLRTDFGLPLEFTDTICHGYPQYFRVVATSRGPALQLTHWDPDLAVSNAELEQEESEEKDAKGKDSKLKSMKLPKGLNLSKGEIKSISQFRKIPYISPYLDFSEFRSGSVEKEKHACGVIHELLSLTIEKRTLVDNLTHFREEFRFSQQLRAMLIRHPDMFYVSLKGKRNSIFLREGYKDSELVVKDRLLVVKEKLRELVLVPEKRGRKSNVNGVEGSTDYDYDDDDDDWSDEYDDDDEMPPDFDEDEGNVNLGLKRELKKVDKLKKNGDNVFVPILSDDRRRECWYITAK